MPKDKKTKISISTILLGINLIILFLPLGGIYLFRLYESDLVRQTESELISQAAVISSTYKKEIKGLIGNKKDYGLLIELSDDNEHPDFRPIHPTIDLFDIDILPQRPDGISNEVTADSIAWDAGRKLSEVLRDTQRVTLAGLKVLDFNGVEVSGSLPIHPTIELESGLSFAHVPEVAQALKGKYASALRERVLDGPPPTLASISRGTGIRVFSAFPIIYEDRLWGVAYLSRTPKSILKHIYFERYKYLSLGIFILLLTISIAIFTSRTISRPIRELSVRAKSIADGNVDRIQPLEAPVTKEIDSLSSNISTMADNLQAKSEYIQNFATRLSHEFKTPLTAIQGAIELLVEHCDEMPVEKRNKFLNNISADTERLKKLVMRLLELAKADNLKPSEETSNIGDVLNRLKDNLVFNGLEIDSKNIGQERIKISPDNLEAILRNLITNSMEHGAGKVLLSTESSNGYLNLIIADDGEGVSERNKEKIFNAFFTTKRTKGGTGLGLGIVKSILSAHDGSIDLAESDKGTKFNLNIPFDIHGL